MKPLASVINKPTGLIIRCKSDPYILANQVDKLLSQTNTNLCNYYMIIKNDCKIRYELPRYLILEELRSNGIRIGYTRKLENISKKLYRKNIKYNLILSNFTDIMTDRLYVEQLQLIKNKCILIDTTDRISEYLSTHDSRLINLPMIEVIDI